MESCIFVTDFQFLFFTSPLASCPDSDSQFEWCATLDIVAMLFIRQGQNKATFWHNFV